MEMAALLPCKLLTEIIILFVRVNNFRAIAGLPDPNWDFRLRFRSLVRSASLLREHATLTLTLDKKF